MISRFRKARDWSPAQNIWAAWYILWQRAIRMHQTEGIFIFADKKSGGITHPRTGSTGSAAGSLEDSCTGIHPLGSDSRADTCGYRHTHPYLSGTHTHNNMTMRDCFLHWIS